MNPKHISEVPEYIEEINAIAPFLILLIFLPTTDIESGLVHYRL